MVKRKRTPEIIEDLAEILINMRQQVVDAVAGCSSRQLQSIVKKLRAEARPSRRCNFPVSGYEQLADIVEGEYHTRFHMQRAKRLRCKVYCVTHANDATKCCHLHG